MLAFFRPSIICSRHLPNGERYFTSLVSLSISSRYFVVVMSSPQCWLNADTASQMVDQHPTSIVATYNTWAVVCHFKNVANAKKYIIICPVFDIFFKNIQAGNIC